MNRIFIFFKLNFGMRRHEFRAARTWINTMYPGRLLIQKLLLFLCWSIKSMWRTIPDALTWVQFNNPVSRTPVWLRDKNPLENHPWEGNPNVKLPDKAQVVVIGAGFAGAGAAYHWSKHGDSRMVILEMNEAASGSGGRNAGVVTMGRYYYYVHSTVLKNLERTRPELNEAERISIAHEFAKPYVTAGIKSNQMIEDTVKTEGIECDYIKKGWVWATDEKNQGKPLAAQRMGEETGFTDWIRISPEEAMKKAGIKTAYDAGHSQGTANWNPAKWIWGLLQIAIQSPNVEFYSQTKVNAVKDIGDFYEIHTDRGTIQAKYVLNATESHTATLFKEFHNILNVGQTQAAYGLSDNGTMQQGVAISSPEMFFSRTKDGILFGSDMSKVPDHEAGLNQPSRFITNYVSAFLKTLFGITRIRVTNEWSGTVGMTPDEFPLIGLQDNKRLYIVGGMAGSGSGVSFLATQFIVFKILDIDCPDYYPEKYFSPKRFFKGRS